MDKLTMRKNGVKSAAVYFAITVIILSTLFGSTIADNWLLYILSVILLGGTGALAGYVLGSERD